jgi:hypothetical protein
MKAHQPPDRSATAFRGAESSVSSDLAVLCRIRAEARRIAANIAKLPEGLRQP